MAHTPPLPNLSQLSETEKDALIVALWTQLHAALAANAELMADVGKIRAAHPDLPVHIYPGGRHAFFNPAQESYDAGAAELALRRKIDFLDRHSCRPAA